MNTVERPSNPSYEFVHYVAKTYDIKAFSPKNQCNHLNVCKGDFFERWHEGINEEKRKERGVEKMPKQVQGIIYALFSENFCTFLHNTGQLRTSSYFPTPKNERNLNQKISEASRVFLVKMNNQIGLERKGTPNEQVWREVFGEAFWLATGIEKKKIISLASRVHEQMNFSYRMRCGIVRAFGRGFGKVKGIGKMIGEITETIKPLFIFYLCNEALNRILAKLKKRCIPKFANLLANTLSIEMFRRLNMGCLILEKIHNSRFKICIVMNLIYIPAQGAILLYRPAQFMFWCLFRYACLLTCLLYLPTLSLFACSMHFLDKVRRSLRNMIEADSLMDVFEERLMATMLLDRNQALQVWMEQMKIAQKEGIPFRACS